MIEEVGIDLLLHVLVRISEHAHLLLKPLLPICLEQVSRVDIHIKAGVTVAPYEWKLSLYSIEDVLSSDFLLLHLLRVPLNPLISCIHSN